LESSTAYEFRVLVSNAESETTAGALETFTTLMPGLLGLPDGRGYEMVTPPDNENADVYVPEGAVATNLPPSEGLGTSGLFRAAADGSAVAFMSDPTVGGNGSAGAGSGNENLATRLASGGWSSKSAQPTGHEGSSFSGFSTDLSVGYLNSYEPLASPAPPQSYFAPYADSFANGEYRPAFTVTPPNRVHGYEFKATHGFLSNNNIFSDASSDLHHLLFEANDALTDAAAQAPPSEGEDDLYDSVEGRLSLVNILPDGAVASNATFGQSYTPLEGNPSEDGLSRVASNDGSRIFWTHLNSKKEAEALYVRENDSQPQSPLGSKGECTIATDACTVQVDASQAGGVGGGGRFWTATADGSEVFFTDSASAGLTNDTEPGSGANLYVYELAGGRLLDLTPGAEVGVEGVVDAGEDGQYVYFVATGVLSGAPNAHGAHAVAGEDNLYVVQRGGSPKFIGTLSTVDGSQARPYTINYSIGDWQPGLGVRTAEATPDGRHLVFMSKQSLTGYDNVLATGSQEGLSEVYVYDADTGALTCVSCSPSGESPPFTSRGKTEGGTQEDAAAYVPLSMAGSYQMRWMSEDGSTVFFDSAEPLVPQDTNGKQDVYEWERDGSGSCGQVPGCVYLLSGGVSESDSWLLDASASGDDAFVITRAKLMPQDGNENFDVYDARIGAIQPIALPVCSGTGCQGVPAAPPIFATPSSVTFAGVGNFTRSAATKKAKTRAKAPTRAQRLVGALRRCHHMKSRAKRRQCEAQAKRKYGSAGSRPNKSAKGRK